MGSTLLDSKYHMYVNIETTKKFPPLVALRAFQLLESISSANPVSTILARSKCSTNILCEFISYPSAHQDIPLPASLIPRSRVRIDLRAWPRSPHMLNQSVKQASAPPLSNARPRVLLRTFSQF